MLIYKFKETVLKIAQEKGMKLYDSHESLLWEIDKELKEGKITVEEAVERLKEHKDFRLNFTSDDFKEIIEATK